MAVPSRYRASMAASDPSSQLAVLSMNCADLATSNPSSELAVPSGNCVDLAASDPSSQLVVPFRNFADLATSDPNSQLEVPSRNCAILVARLLGSSLEKLRNPYLLTLHAGRPVPLENCANLDVQPLLTVHSRKCAEHACLALKQPGLSIPKFAQFCLPAKPNPLDSHCRLRFSVSISQ